ARMDALLDDGHHGHRPAVVENMGQVGQASLHSIMIQRCPTWSQKSHLILHRLTRILLARHGSFRQSPHVRWLPLLTTLLMPLAASAGTASDPAFLGIGMDDGPGFCSISSITPASPAQEAGVQFGDAIVSIDGVSTAGPQPC